MNSETIWLISVAVDVYDTAAPVTARRELESAKHWCDEQRQQNKGEDYSVDPIRWEEGKSGQVTGQADIHYTIDGEEYTTTQLFILEEINLED